VKACGAGAKPGLVGGVLGHAADIGGLFWTISVAVIVDMEGL